MAVLTLGWTIIESYKDGGIVRSLFDVNEMKGHISESATDIHSMSPTSRSALVAPQASQLQTSYHSIIDLVRPAVVSIDAAVTAPAPQQAVTVPDMGGDPSLIAANPVVNYTRVGSGVIIDPKGYILSSLHVVIQADSLKATVYDANGAREYPVKIVNADKTTDLALLLIQSDVPVQFPHADLGDSNLVQTGDVVLAMGSPFGFDQTVTNGIISSRHRTLKIGNDIYNDMLQTDTPINKGNSGGPLVNAKGEVIGINTAIYSPNGVFTGIGFAVPTSKAETLVAGLVDFENTPTQVATGQIVVWANRGKQMGNTFKLPNGQVLMPPHAFRGKCIECHPQLCTAQNGNMLFGPGFIPQGGNLQGNVNNQGAAVAFGQLGQNNPQPFLGALLVDVDPIIADKFGLLHPQGVLVDRVYPQTPA
ncbi:MAG: trypsin-like peptidase domain-containing protein, partial [Nitrospirae bacterium]|nr:trypsin-like peptidase domain-containing protein [Nitrospirota bacterium]